MVRRGYTSANAHRALARIEKKAQARARDVAAYIVDMISFYAPRDPLHTEHTGGVPLAESYKVTRDRSTGDFLISSSRRYWAFVEFGTAEHGGAQPHVRPAIDRARVKFK